MPEAKWLAATTLYELNLPRNTKGQHRKWRLLAAAWCRRAVTLAAPDPRLVQLLEAAERFADGEIGAGELKQARKALTAIRKEVGGDQFGPQEVLYDTAMALDCATSSKPAVVLSADEPCRFAVAVPSKKARRLKEWDRCLEAERVVQLRLARCLFGNPFRPVPFPTNWRTVSAVALASAIYADRAFDRLPILADALEEAGCDHPDVLAHLREPHAPHARGCWVVDGVLGRT